MKARKQFRAIASMDSYLCRLWGFVIILISVANRNLTIKCFSVKEGARQKNNFKSHPLKIYIHIYIHVIVLVGTVFLFSSPNCLSIKITLPSA
jgi:hypothetical protein